VYTNLFFERNEGKEASQSKGERQEPVKEQAGEKETQRAYGREWKAGSVGAKKSEGESASR